MRSSFSRHMPSLMLGLLILINAYSCPRGTNPPSGSARSQTRPFIDTVLIQELEKKVEEVVREYDQLSASSDDDESSGDDLKMLNRLVARLKEVNKQSINQQKQYENHNFTSLDLALYVEYDFNYNQELRLLLRKIISSMIESGAKVGKEGRINQYPLLVHAVVTLNSYSLLKKLIENSDAEAVTIKSEVGIPLEVVYSIFYDPEYLKEQEKKELAQLVLSKDKDGEQAQELRTWAEGKEDEQEFLTWLNELNESAIEKKD